MLSKRIALGAAVAVGIGSIAGTAQGAFTLVDDFDGIAVGSVNGENGWTASDNSIDVVADGFDGNGLQNGNNSTWAAKTIPTIATGTTGTLFFQFNASNLASGQSFGLADSNLDGTIFNSYRPQLALTGSGPFTARDGGDSLEIDSVSLQPDTWYSVWMVVNNDTKTWEAYIQGGAIASQTKIASEGENVFNFRDSEQTAADLVNFVYARGNGTGDSVIIDNIMVDTTGENLSNPIPEPSVLAMSGLLSVGLLARRRRW